MIEREREGERKKTTTMKYILIKQRVKHSNIHSKPFNFLIFNCHIEDLTTTTTKFNC